MTPNRGRAGNRRPETGARTGSRRLTQWKGQAGDRHRHRQPEITTGDRRPELEPATGDRTGTGNQQPKITTGDRRLELEPAPATGNRGSQTGTGDRCSTREPGEVAAPMVGSVMSGESWMLPLVVNQVPTLALVDTGASVTMISRTVWEEMDHRQYPLLPWLVHKGYLSHIMDVSITVLCHAHNKNVQKLIKTQGKYRNSEF